MSKTCSICEKRKSKRICPALGGKGICPECCVSRRDASCADCEHYIAGVRAMIDRFRTSGKHPFNINTTHKDTIHDILEELAFTNDLDAAEEALESYADDNSPFYLYARGVIGSMYCQDDEEVIEDLLDAIWHYPFFFYAWYNLSSALLELGYLAFAYDALQIVVNLTPPNYDLHIKAKDRLLELAGMYDESDVLFPLKEVIIRNQVAIYYEKITPKEPQRAADAFIKMLEEEPDKARYRAALGLCYAYLGRRDDAIRELRAALEVFPDNENTKANLEAVEKSQNNEEITGLTPITDYDYRSELINRYSDKPEHAEAIRMLFKLYFPAPPTDK